jgi:hypothetical protein
MFLWPVLSTDLARTSVATTYNIRVERTTTATVPFPASALTALRYYWFAGDGQADGIGTGDLGGIGDLCALLQATLNAHPSGAGFTVTLSVDNRITIANATAFRILWADALTTLNAVPFGFAQTSPGATATSFVAPNQTRGAFCPRRWPSSDSRDVSAFASGAAVSMSGRTRIARHATARAVRDIEYELLQQRYGIAEYADATEPTGTLEHVWTEALSRGFPVRYYEDETSRTSSSYRLYVLRAEEMRSGVRTEVVDRSGRYRVRWDGKLPLRRVTL